MANTWINHPSGLDTNGGGYDDTYTGTWSQWHDGSFDFLVGVAVNATVTDNGSGKARITLAGAFGDALAGIMTYISDFAGGTYAAGRYPILAVDASGNWIDLDLAYDTDTTTDSVYVGGALDGVDDARAELANDGDRQLICTNATVQSTYPMAAGTTTWPDLNIEVMGVDEADGSRLSFDRFKAADAAGNLLPKIYNETTSATNYLFNHSNFVSGIMFVGRTTAAAVNHGSLNRTVFSDCSMENASTGTGHGGFNSTTMHCRIVRYGTLKNGQLINNYIIGDTDSGTIVTASSALAMWGLFAGNIVENVAATKTTVVGLSLGITTYTKNNCVGNTVINCATGISITSSDRIGVGIVGNNLVYNCTNAYGITGDFTALANQFLYDRNAYNGTRNLPAGARDAGTDLVLTADPFVNSAAGDYRLDPDGAQFADLYDDDTGTFIGALGPELPEGGGGWRPRPRLIGV